MTASPPRRHIAQGRPTLTGTARVTKADGTVQVFEIAADGTSKRVS